MTNALRSGPVQPSRRIRRAIGTLAAAAAAVAVGVIASPGGGRTIEAAGGTLGAGGEFHEIVPDRVFDSRDAALDISYGSIPAGRKPTGPLATAPEIVVPIVGEGGLPAFVDDDSDGFDDNVLAVVVNITVISPNHSGYLRAFGTGTTQGETSVVNFSGGQRVPNSAIIRPGQNGAISLRLITPDGVGDSHVAVDVSGWYSTSEWDENGARTVAIDPARIYDSRDAQFGAAPVGAGGQVDITMRGAKRMGTSSVVVPDDPDVVGVIVNITGVNKLPGSKPTYVSILPAKVSNASEVTTSNLNLDTGGFRANLAIVPLATGDDDLTLFNFDGQIHLIVDVVGYLLAGQDPDTTAGRIVPIEAPFRALDTRKTEHYAQPLGPARAEDWSFDAFVDDVAIDGDPVGEQVGFFGNLTATGLQRQYPWADVQTFLTAYPSPATPSPPNVSNLNLGEGVAVPNMALLRYGSGTGGDHEIAVYNSQGYVHYILDVYAVVLA